MGFCVGLGAGFWAGLGASFWMGLKSLGSGYPIGRGKA